MVHLGVNIRKMRIEQKVSIIELAKRVQVTEAFILNLESGKIPNPSFFKILKIARELNMDLNELEDTYIDPEWVSLIKEARNLGLSSDEVRKYLQHHIIMK